MNPEKNNDFSLFQGDLTKKIEELVKIKTHEKMNSCFSLYQENFDNFSKCLYPFEKSIQITKKFVKYSSIYFKLHLDKCKSFQNEEDINNCLQNIKNNEYSIFLKYKNQIASLE